MSTLLKQRVSKTAASQRVNLRVHPKLKRLLLEAAETQHLPLTDFMLNAARTAAEVTMADRTVFALEAGKWRELYEALDKEPCEIPALRSLFRGKSVFQGR